MTDLDRALAVARTWQNEAITKGTRSTAPSRRRLATIIAALAEAQKREQALRALHESRPAAQLGKLSEVCWNCYPRPYPCETIRTLNSTHDREAGT
jgi:hypothetical protein